MSDLLRDIGVLEARMDEHDRRFDGLEKKVDDGFEGINRKLDGLRAAEDKRKGAIGLVKLILGATGIAGVIEFVKELLHR